MRHRDKNDDKNSNISLLLQRSIWVFIFFISVNSFAQIYTGDKNTIIYGRENISESATISPNLSENNEIYIAGNTLVYTTNTDHNSTGALESKSKNPTSENSQRKALYAEKKTQQKKKTLASTAKPKSSTCKISNAPLPESFFSKNSLSKTACLVHRLDEFAKGVHSVYFYKSQTPSTSENRSLLRYSRSQMQNVLLLATSIRPPPMVKSYPPLSV